MSDLLALQPNLEINLFLVAPDEQQDKVEQEILRPTFALREKPLARLRIHHVLKVDGETRRYSKARGLTHISETRLFS